MSLFSNIFKSSQLPADQDGLFSGKNRFHAVNYKNEKPTLFSARRNYSATKSSLDGSLDGSSTEAKVQRKKKHKDIRSIDKPVAESDISKKRSREKNNARKVSALHETEKTDRGAATSKKKRKVYNSEEPSPVIEKELNKDQEKERNLDPAEKETSVRSGKQTLSLQEVKRLKRTIFVGNLPSIAVKKSKILERLFSRWDILDDTITCLSIYKACV